MAQRKKLKAFAIVRIDEFLGSDVAPENRITVKRILWDEEEARTEVARLNAMGEGCRYFWQTTRVDPPADSTSEEQPS